MTTGGWSDLAHTILDAATQCLEDGTVGAPQDRFVAHATPAADCCDQLAVWASQAVPAGTGEQCGQPARIIFQVRVLRPCQPGLDRNGNPPSITEMEAAADALLVDAKTLWCCLAPALRAQTDNPSWSILAAFPVETEGLCAGWIVTLSVEDDDCCVE